MEQLTISQAIIKLSDLEKSYNQKMYLLQELENSTVQYILELDNQKHLCNEPFEFEKVFNDFLELSNKIHKIKTEISKLNNIVEIEVLGNKMTIQGALNQMKSEFQVSDVDGLKEILKEQLGREATDADLLYELINRGFGSQVTGQLTNNMKYNVKAMRDTVISTLMDYTGSMNYYQALLKEYSNRIGRAMQWEIPFTNISKKIADAEQLYEIGTKARTAISYRVTATRC